MVEADAREPLWRVLLFDVTPAVAFLVMGLVDLYAPLTEPYGDAPLSSAVIPIVLASASLLIRRRWPLAALAIAVAVVVIPAMLFSVLLTLWGQFLVWVVAMYSVGRHEPWERAVWAPIISLAGFGVVIVRYPGLHIASDVLIDVVMLLGAWGIGRLIAGSASNRAKAMALELERARAEERAALSERTRIARELHDVVSHSITVIVMQAGGARLAAATDPGAANRALELIENVGRETLHELATMLKVLRNDDAGAAPQPVLANIPTLCARMLQLGMTVDVDVAEGLDHVPPGVQLAAYRIVQEGLTNILKHAGPVPTSVVVSRDQGALEVRVASASGRDDGALGGSELGLVGLRERVDSLGGQLQAGPSGDGYGIRAVLPTAVAT
jgi:signal transduction histidine kinase